MARTFPAATAGGEVEEYLSPFVDKVGCGVREKLQYSSYKYIVNSPYSDHLDFDHRPRSMSLLSACHQHLVTNVDLLKLSKFLAQTL